MTWHKNSILIAIGAICLIAVVFGGCDEGEPTPAAESSRKPVVCVVNYPLQYFTERIAGNEMDVRFPAPADEDPAFWRPRTDEIVAYQSSDLIILNGATYTKWIATASLPASKMIDTSASFGDRFIRTDGATAHIHGPEGEHAHAGVAFTTWLDFRQAIAQAKAINDALNELLPESAEIFSANFDVLQDELSDLDSRMISIAKQIGDEPIVASHPVYQYWARRYGLNVKAVMWEPEIVPDDKAMHDLRKILADHPAKLMIWEGEPDPKSTRWLETIGVQSTVFDPCGNLPDKGDFMTVMEHNIGALRGILRDSTSRTVRD